MSYVCVFVWGASKPAHVRCVCVCALQYVWYSLHLCVCVWYSLHLLWAAELLFTKVVELHYTPDRVCRVLEWRSCGVCVCVECWSVRVVECVCVCDFACG